ncbi:hypothetical protein [Thiohalocapsa sp. ML1]|uniref:CIS tube protein n=1 Tax=Thiohalocapsa sp. ML1 TaxID=1431688 RepID=UPI000ACD3441|nr:hypothetical protein [Thiohalocapsa sp. ML1]
MTEPTHAKLFPVEGPADRGDPATAIDVQFNPMTLKVALSNALKANENADNGSAAQFVDKSTSSLTVELQFDTSIEDTDVRLKTKAIAEAFMKPGESGDQQLAPKRCLFQWGAFEFVGMMASYDETLDFFSPEGTPLRATLGIKLNEDRYQFRQSAARKSARETPTFGGAGADTASTANKDAGQDERAWRDTAMYNGQESPRQPAPAGLAVPGQTASAALGAQAAIGASGSLTAGPKADIGAPGFSFGASATLGTEIPGAFSPAAVSRIGPPPGMPVSPVAPGSAGAGLPRPGLGVGIEAGVRASNSVGFD